MPSFAGEFQYLDASGKRLQGGLCQLSWDAEKLTLAPGTGAALAFDLGDIDVFLPGDYQLTLTLYTGESLQLLRFGKAFQDLSSELLNAYRNRLVQCLLLDDLEELARFTGFAQLHSLTRTLAGRAEMRLYKSNFAVLPEAATGFQWRLADIDAVQFDATTYAVTLHSAEERLEVTRLAKRTEEFLSHLQDAVAEPAEIPALCHCLPENP